MAAINKRHERNRVSYDILNNLSSVDLFYEKYIERKFKEPARPSGSWQEKRTQM
jgi:hypothetical protein